MLYLHDGHLREIGIDWTALTGVIEHVVRIRAAGDCVQPLKPYLRYRNPANRIIAMPAFVGGGVDMAGIKWIASFPGNRGRGLPRAYNIVVLNRPDTGEPAALFRSGLLSGLRTAAVSGLMLTAFLARRPIGKIRIGIVGWGPIGRIHLDMFAALLGSRLDRAILYDLHGIDPDTIPEAVRGITDIADDWRAPYRSSDAFVTCTVSDTRYIDEAPPRGALLLNVSLRDYKPESVAGMKAIVVDDWTEVCREGTDIERLARHHGLRQADTVTLEDVVCGGALSSFAEEEPVFFNPMGLAAFDIGVARHYYGEALRLGKGIPLEPE